MFYSKSVTVRDIQKYSLETFLKSHHSYTVELIQTVVTHTPEYFCAVQGQMHSHAVLAHLAIWQYSDSSRFTAAF